MSHKNPKIPAKDYLLVGSAVQTIFTVQDWLITCVQNDPKYSFSEQIRQRDKKPFLIIDREAEEKTKELLEHAFGGSKNILVIGEERLDEPTLDLSKEKRIVALLDMIDGTDLFTRHLSNWCSAIVFYQKGKILGSFVGLPHQGVFFATRNTSASFRFLPLPPITTFTQASLFEPKYLPVEVPSADVTLDDASICCYGQKIKNFLSLSQHEALISKFKQLSTADPDADPDTRIYNFAGNPMMIRLLELPDTKPINAVIDLHGQWPHDVVPGAYIAQRAGAIITDLSGNSIDFSKSLLQPANKTHKLKYILASSKKLHAELLEILKP